MGALTSALGGIIALLGRKSTVVGVTLTAFGLLTAAFIVSINTLVASIAAYLSMPSWIANSVGMFIPSDFAAVLAAIMAARISRAAYDLAMDKIKAINQAS